MGDDLSAMMEQDGLESGGKPSDSQLSSISELALEQIRLEELLRKKEEELETVKADLSRVRDFQLPEAMLAINLNEFTLTDGFRVSIKEDIYTGITEEKRPEAFRWLRETNNDGIIKNEYKLNFGKGQDEDARKLEQTLKEEGFSFSSKESVHPQTLKAFIKKRLEKGEPTPFDVFSIHVRKVASITR